MAETIKFERNGETVYPYPILRNDSNYAVIGNLIVFSKRVVGSFSAWGWLIIIPGLSVNRTWDFKSQHGKKIDAINDSGKVIIRAKENLDDGDVVCGVIALTE